MRSVLKDILLVVGSVLLLGSTVTFTQLVGCAKFHCSVDLLRQRRLTCFYSLWQLLYCSGRPRGVQNQARSGPELDGEAQRALKFILPTFKRRTFIIDGLAQWGLDSGTTVVAPREELARRRPVLFLYIVLMHLEKVTSTWYLFISLAPLYEHSAVRAPCEIAMWL